MLDLAQLRKILAHPLGFTRRPITLRNHIPKSMYFPDKGCVRPLRHLYGYATAGVILYIISFYLACSVGSIGRVFR